ncbi:cation:proton antiporter [Synechococcus sp. PCC 6312]|uniref:cation:proton antiporter n=1 Tax=Synechococcus sp. (strain ATCC 27167 / PCC 6312) TaxID=195253 RepID=UPI00029ECAEC|nr:cation:proton antiporter [Synechococcus sp. PCC 6312]AFY60930.1 Kef-type K+ transport system, membrane component [Synechococcus sp. PCC 6312]
METQTLLLILFDICLIIGLARLVGHLFTRINQPPVMGEIVAGIMLGPSLLGWLAPQAEAILFPKDVMPSIYLLSQIGLIFFMFLVGLDVSPENMRGRLRVAIATSNISILVPFALGVSLALTLLQPLRNNPEISNLAFALFLGAAMSVTAFPVLARIIKEKNLQKTSLGLLALTCASVDDITAWCLLAMAIIATRSNDIFSAWPTFVGISIFTTLMMTVGRRWIEQQMRAWERRSPLTLNQQTMIYILLILSAIGTQLLNIDVIFGGFIMGVIMPKNLASAVYLRERIQDFVTIFLLPLFFAYSGINTQIGLVNTPTLWGLTILILLAAVLGKFGGTYWVSRWTGLPAGEAAALGLLMNTRGLTELIILNVGLSLKVISPVLFTMLVIMALVTTFIASPLMDRVYPGPLSDPSRWVN